MGGSGFTQTFAELDAAANRLSHLLRAAGVEPGDHVAICMENHPRYLEVVWGCHYAGLVYTGALVPADRAASSTYILNDCEAKVFITSQYKADQAAEIVADTPGVELRLMLDGTIDGYESLRGRRRRPAGRAARPTASPAPTCSTRPARPAARRACTRRSRPSRWPTGTSGVARVMPAAVRRRRHDRSTSPPRRYYHAAPLRFSLGDAGPRRHGRGDGALRRRGVPARSSSATTSPTARSCRRCSCACSSCPTEVRAQVRRVVAASASSTPPRRARSPVKQQMIEWFGPVIHEYYAGTEGNGFVYCNSEQWLAHPGTVGHADRLHRAHRRRGRRGGAARRDRARSTSRAARTFEYHNDPEKTKGSRHPQGLAHARRRRLPRRRQLPVPHRPQGVHDHLRRREHLPPGGRERARHPPQGGRRRRVRRAQRRLRRGGQGGRAAGRRCRPTTPRPTRWPRS